MAANGPSASASVVGSSEVVRDSFIPLFDGKPTSYREYPQRLVLHYKKMKLNKRPIEVTINLLTSLTGTAWRQVQHLAESASETEDGFQQVLDALDKASSTMIVWRCRGLWTSSFTVFIVVLTRPSLPTAEIIVKHFAKFRNMGSASRSRSGHGSSCGGVA